MSCYCLAGILIFRKQREEFVGKGRETSRISFDWMNDPKNRSFTVETDVIYEDASSGSIRAYDPTKKKVIDPIDGKEDSNSV